MSETKVLPPIVCWTSSGMRAVGIGTYVDLHDYVRMMNRLEEKLQIATSALDTIGSQVESSQASKINLAREALLKMGHYTSGQ